MRTRRAKPPKIGGLWIGKAEIRPLRGSSVLEDAKGAFVNVVAWARDAEEFGPRRFLLTAALMLAFILRTAHAATPQAQPQSTQPPANQAPADPERQRANDLFKAGNFVEAMPLFEKLAADHPDDAGIKASWAFSVSAYAATLSDPELRKKARIRARAIALEAKKQGYISATVQMVLEIPEDGSEPSFSDKEEVDDSMKSAEADFARGDLEKARTGYLHALLLDPKNYAAALFIGDVYYKQHANGSAGEWFARAIQIDPNRETAYRYWGDALLAMAKPVEAREQYINAVIAEPYGRASWSGLAQWAQRTNARLNLVRMQDKVMLTQDGDKLSVTLDPSIPKASPNAVAWTAYGTTRVKWRADFSSRFPKEPKYRRTMKEEFDCLTAMANVMREQKDPSTLQDLDPAIQAVMKAQEAGLLEPFVFFNRPDTEISQDYGPYREAHRTMLYRYFDEFVVPKAVAQ